MPTNHAVLAHGAWADGSSWSKVMGPLEAEGINVVAAPLPLISLADGVAAVDHVLERVKGPVVLAGHAYGGTVIGETRSPKVTSLFYIAALAPDEGETIGDFFYRGQAHSAVSDRPIGHAAGTLYGIEQTTQMLRSDWRFVTCIARSAVHSICWLLTIT